MKSIIITGTSSGLGQALFDYISTKQLGMICIARKFLPYQEELAAQSGKVISLIEQDLRCLDEEFFSTLLAAIPKNSDEVFFINNAGVIDPIGKMGSIADAALMSAIKVNFLAPALLVNNIMKFHAVLGIQTSFINITSGAANQVIEGWGAYCSTKAGTKMFFDVLQQEIKDSEQFKIYNIDPGVLATRMQSIVRNSGFPPLEEQIMAAKENKPKQPKDVARWIVETYIGKNI